MLLTTLRTDTGSLDPNCRTMSDAIACAFLNPGWVCEGTGATCRQLAESLLSSYGGEFEMTRSNYLYLFTIEPEGFMVRDESGQPLVLRAGNLNESVRQETISANERIVKEGNIFKAQLKIASAEQPQN